MLFASSRGVFGSAPGAPEKWRRPPVLSLPAKGGAAGGQSQVGMCVTRRHTPVMRLIVSIIGAVLGLGLATSSHELLGLLLGACTGFGAVELVSLRDKLKQLETETGALRKQLAQLRGEVRPRESAPEEPVSGWSTAASSGPRAPMGVPTASPGAPTTATAPPAMASTRSTSRDIAKSGGNIGQQIGQFVRDYFTGGNTVVRIGIIILFFGVAFLLRYAAEHSHVPIEFRLSGVAAGGLALLVLGWRLRKSRAGYALALQGGAVGILYLTVFAGLRIYAVMPASAAFMLLVAVAALSVALAILQNSQSFALLAVTGGFLAPILASTGQGSHVVLFSYYAVLNGAIVAVAWFKAWRTLNLAGFLFTFVIGTAWGALSYRPEFFSTTEPFLVLFFLFYVVIAVLFASRQTPELRGYVDGTLVFGTPIVAFGLQSAMLHQQHFTLAYSALAMSAFYLMLAAVLHRTRQASHRLLVESFMALGILFLTLAVPLALDGRWSAATWAVEGAALVWIGCRQQRRPPRAFGALLQIAGGLIFLFDIDAPHGSIPILNSAYLGGVMVSAASVFAAAMLVRYQEGIETDGGLLPIESASMLGPVLFFWGLLWWLFSGLTEIQRSVPDRYEAAAGLVLMAFTALISSELHQRARMVFARLPPIGLLPVMIIYAGIAALEVHHPFADGGWLGWPLAFATFYFVCKRHEGEPGGFLANALHVGSAWLLTALLSWEVAWAIDKGVAGGGSWPMIAWALIPAVALFALPRLVQWLSWPVGLHKAVYLGIAAVGLAFYLGIWSLLTNLTLPGNPYPLPFVPLLNPLDLAELFVVVVLVRFWLYLRHAALPNLSDLQEGPILGLLAGVAFVWLNAALLRAIHHWAGVPFGLWPMLSSTLVETSLSIFWTLLALTTMLIATRTAARAVWIVGAGLLGVAIAKLFVIDLSRIGTIERIISFVGVGLLTLVIGYFSPLPPAAKDARV
jgi:uncharacterized membrane protein